MKCLVFYQQKNNKFDTMLYMKEKLRKVLISVVTRCGCCEFVRLIRAREKVLRLLLLAFDYTIRFLSNLLIELIPYLYIYSFFGI